MAAAANESRGMRITQRYPDKLEASVEEFTQSLDSRGNQVYMVHRGTCYTSPDQREPVRHQASRVGPMQTL